MHGAAPRLARRLRAAGAPPDVVLATDMLDLATFLGLTRSWLGDRPVALYMHENQLTYPEPRPQPGWDASRRARAERRDDHYAFVNLCSGLAADLVLWNSAHNRDAFLDALPGFLGRFPDEREPGLAEALRARSEVLPLGLDLAALDAARPAGPRESGPPRILWSHRWEQDKDPARFLAALERLEARGAAFELVLLGASTSRRPGAFEAACERFGPRLRHAGFAESRDAYAAWLWRSDIVVSTARHEFFGAAVAEAIHAGCRAVLPRRLAYPELFPPSTPGVGYYDDDAGLDAALDAALAEAAAGEPPPAAARQAVAAYDWSRMAPRYDARLAALAAVGVGSATLQP